MTMNNGAAKITKKLAEIVKKVTHIEKRGRNEFHHYDYVMESDVVEALRGHLADAGIICVPQVESVRTEKLDKGLIATIEASYIFSDGEETVTVRVGGMGYDTPGDKSIYKAMTGAEKYALKQLFLIPTGDDPERDLPPQRGRTTSSAEPAKGAADSRPGEPAAGVRNGRPDSEPDRRQPAAGRATTIPFNGKTFKKGQTLGELTEAGLKDWTSFCEEAVRKNDKKWHRSNEEKLAECMTEWERRQPWRGVWKRIQAIGADNGLDKEGCEVILKDKMNVKGADKLAEGDVAAFEKWMDELKKG